MLEKLLLAVMMTFGLNLFLATRLPLKTTTDSNYHLAETAIILVELVK